MYDYTLQFQFNGYPQLVSGFGSIDKLCQFVSDHKLYDYNPQYVYEGIAYEIDMSDLDGMRAVNGGK